MRLHVRSVTHTMARLLKITLLGPINVHELLRVAIDYRKPRTVQSISGLYAVYFSALISSSANSAPLREPSLGNHARRCDHRGLDRASPDSRHSLVDATAYPQCDTHDGSPSENHPPWPDKCP